GVEPLLRVRYHFHWQMSYRLAEPLFLKAGTELQAVAWFDNSKANPHNPDPTAAVRWGEQTYDEMMVGFFDVAVDPQFDKRRFFERGHRAGPSELAAQNPRCPAQQKTMKCNGQDTRGRKEAQPLFVD